VSLVVRESPRAWALGRYPRSAIAWRTTRRRVSLTCGASRRTSETMDLDTCARSATSPPHTVRIASGTRRHELPHPRTQPEPRMTGGELTAAQIRALPHELVRRPRARGIHCGIKLVGRIIQRGNPCCGN
jgi:hypothetical protein